MLIVDCDRLWYGMSFEVLSSRQFKSCNVNVKAQDLNETEHVVNTCQCPSCSLLSI